MLNYLIKAVFILIDVYVDVTLSLALLAYLCISRLEQQFWVRYAFMQTQPFN